MKFRKLEVFYRGDSGCGCFKKSIDVTCENFVSENDKTITILETDLDQWGSYSPQEVTYFKDINAFIESENNWFVKHINEIKERHEKTLSMAMKYKEKLEKK